MVRIMIDTKGYDHKPEEAIRSIQYRIHTETMSIEDVGKYISQGYSVKFGVLSGRTADTFMEQQLFALDIDEGIGIEDAYKIFVDKGITPVFIYKSFSYTEEHPKFRMVFCSDTVITDKTLRDNIQKTLMSFISADKHCKDAGRLFFGTKYPVICENYAARFSYHILEPYFEQPKVKRSRVKKDKTDFVYPTVDIADISEITKRAGRFILNHLDRILLARKWVKGDHRERLLFIIHNIKTILEEDDAELIEKINDSFKEPLYAREVKQIYTHRAYIFTPKSVIQYLELNDEEVKISGLLENIERKKQRHIRQADSSYRDRLIAEGYYKGLGYNEINLSLPEHLRYKSKNSIKNVINRLHLKDCESIYDVDFIRRYTREDKIRMYEEKRLAGGGANFPYITTFDFSSIQDTIPVKENISITGSLSDKGNISDTDNTPITNDLYNDNDTSVTEDISKDNDLLDTDILSKDSNTPNNGKTFYIYNTYSNSDIISKRYLLPVIRLPVYGYG